MSAGFDVFVVGTANPRTEARLGLAQALAAQRGAPVDIVARAIEARALRAGQGLDRASAEEMANELRALGAVVELRPVGPPTGAGASPFAGAPSSGVRVGGPPTVATPDGQPTMVTPYGGSTHADAMGGPTVVTPQFGAMGPGSDMPTPPAAPIPTLQRSAAPPPGRGRDPFAPRGDAGEMKIELAGAHPRGAGPAASAPGASALNTDKLSAGSSSSKMAVEKEGANPNLTRCTVHGLYFDKKKASGCMKCLAGARSAARQFESRMTGFKLMDFKDAPAKRAFVGLALALFIGFLPAAFVAVRVGGAQITALRGEQEDLSRKVGTESNLARFDEIEHAVESAHTKSKYMTFAVWVLFAGGAMLGWYRFTEG